MITELIVPFFVGVDFTTEDTKRFTEGTRKSEFTGFKFTADGVIDTIGDTSYQ